MRTDTPASGTLTVTAGTGSPVPASVTRPEMPVSSSTRDTAWKASRRPCPNRVFGRCGPWRSSKNDVSTIAATRSSGDSCGSPDSISAAVPATWGAAIEVPLETPYGGPSEAGMLERTATPGADRSGTVQTSGQPAGGSLHSRRPTSAPLENSATSSSTSVAPTDSASTMSPGLPWQPSPQLPAAATGSTPAR